MNKPLIGITCNTTIIEGEVFTGRGRTFVNSDYVASIVRAGGTPLLLPPVLDEAVIKAQVESLDGFVFSGGPDVDPLLYGEEPDSQLGVVNHERDTYEKRLVQLAGELGKPMLGICRGAQIINVACGGSLYQDIVKLDACTIKHMQSSVQRDALWHSAVIEPASKLAAVLGEHKLLVNSYHHQAIKTPAPGFAVVARAQDGTVEAVEREVGPWTIGVQWHPELLSANHASMLALFETLVREARGTIA